MPRKKIDESLKKKTISIALPPSIIQAVTEIAEHGNLTISATISELLMYAMKVMYIQEQQKQKEEN